MATTDWIRVGRRIRKLRRQKGISQRALAGRRITPAALSMIENGKRRPSSEVLSYLADRLGTTDDYLSTGRDPGIETRLRLQIEGARLAVHQGRAEPVLKDVNGYIDAARKAELGSALAAAFEVRGAALQKLGLFEDAIASYDDAAELLAAEPVEHQVAARCGRARCLYLSGDVHYAVHVLEVLLADLRRRPAADPTAFAHVYSALVGPYFKSGLVDKAKAAGEEARRLAARVTEPELVGCMHINLAGIYLSEGRVEAASRALTRAEDCFTQLEWLDEVATTRIAQAMAAIDIEDWSDARDHLLSALDALREMPDPTSMATTLNQLGRVERVLGNVADARTYLQHALDHVSDGNPNERGLAQRELALCAMADGDTAEARRFLDAAISSYRDASNALQVGVTYKVLGDLEARAGENVTDLYREGLEAATAGAL